MVCQGMLRVRRKEKATRCPWCFSSEPGAGWVTCPRDDTAVHVECAREYGTCPICRQPVEQAAQAETPTGTQRARRSAGDAPLVAPLPAGVAATLRAIRRAYRRLSPTALALGAGASAFLALAASALLHPLAGAAVALGAVAAAAVAAIAPRQPEARLLVDPARASAAQREAAERLAAGDAEALAAAGRFRAARSQSFRAQRALRAAAPRLRQAYRRALEQETSVEEAARVDRVRREALEELVRAGVATLADLLRRPYLEEVVGREQASLLLDWADDRVVAIERLAGSGDFPGRDDAERRFASDVCAERDRAARAQQAAAHALEQLEAWQRERPQLVAALAE